MPEGFTDLHLEAEKTEGCKKLWNKKFPENKELLIPKFVCSPRWAEMPLLAAGWQKPGVNSAPEKAGRAWVTLSTMELSRNCLWEESQALICFWSSAGSLAALWALGNVEKQSVVCF